MLLAAGLPRHLLARVFSHLFWPVPLDSDGVQYTTFDGQSNNLRQAIRLASVCTLWREAAADAVQSLLLRLWPRDEAHPRWLSSLVGTLVQGCSVLCLGPQLLAAPIAPGLVQACKPDTLELYTTGQPVRVPCDLAACTTLRRLDCREVYPSSLPPALVWLSLGFCLRRARPRTLRRVRALLHGLPGLASLTELTLRFRGSGCSMTLTPRLSLIPALQRLDVHMELAHTSIPCDLSPLQLAAALGVQVSLHVTLQDVDCNMGGSDSDDEEADSDLLTSANRRLLWAALAQVPQLSKLYLKSDDLLCVENQAEVAGAEHHALASVSCGVLVLTRQDWQAEDDPSHLSAALLCTIQCNLVHVYHYMSPDYALPWSQLTARPGVYILDSGSESPSPGHRVSGCRSCLPGFSQPWALVIRQQHFSSVSGLPLSQFQAGPRGHMVWRNHAVLDRHLLEAFADWQEEIKDCWLLPL